MAECWERSNLPQVDVSVYWENDIIKREIHDSWLEGEVLG